MGPIVVVAPDAPLTRSAGAASAAQRQISGVRHREGMERDVHNAHPRHSELRPHRPTGASLIALMAIVVTVAGIAVLHVVRTDLDWRAAVMSTYANGPAGDVMSLVFYAFGAVAVALAVRLRTAVVRHGITSVFPWLMVLAGAGSILAGIFEVDPGILPSTTAEVIHSTSAIAAFVLLVAAMGLFTLATRDDHRWDRLRRPSEVLSVLAAAAAGTTQLVDHTGWTGAAQRVLAGAVLAWFLLVALYVRTRRFAAGGAS
jgi:Protein of unknown function (DUF998)